MTAKQVAVAASFYITRAEQAGITINDGNVVDLLADNLDATLNDIREGLRLANISTRFPKATRKQ